MFRPKFLPLLTLVSCVLFTLPPTRAGDAGQTQASDELPGLKLATAWSFEPPVPVAIEPAPPPPPNLNRLRITGTRRITVTRRKPEPEPEQLYCVRLCDGFYFPMTKVSNASVQREAGLCNALCPEATTAVYVLTSADGGMNAAVARVGGKAYNSLPTAFSYRRSISPHCSCQRLGNPTQALSLDLTLKAGDIVVTDKGVRQFHGSRSFPYPDKDFTAYSSGSGMSSATLRYLSMIDRPYQSMRVTPEWRKKLSEQLEKGVQLRDRLYGLVD